jgi:predicted lipase
VAFDDEFQQHELVYAIWVNRLHKRITVIFRGSTTQTDWATNYQVYMKEIPNPTMACHKSQESTVQVHNGFCEYMFTHSERGVTGTNGEALSEYEEILQEHVLPVLQE